VVVRQSNETSDDVVTLLLASVVRQPTRRLGDNDCSTKNRSGVSRERHAPHIPSLLYSQDRIKIGMMKINCKAIGILKASAFLKCLVVA
jgi:hypothetical protein